MVPPTSAARPIRRRTTAGSRKASDIAQACSLFPQPFDLLVLGSYPGKGASSLAAWLAKRPRIEVICRDRAPFFAEDATAGAPQATRVADRWHLWHNLGEAAERTVARHRQCLRVLVPEPAGDEGDEPMPLEGTSGSPWKSDRFANRVRARHATVHALLEAGHSRRSIGRQLHMTHEHPDSGRGCRASARMRVGAQTDTEGNVCDRRRQCASGVHGAR
ncbi:transposase [Streptomyces sp. NPDC057486]|uniref:transposase n=1 Tax=Streptomyces sp. NPDC057486 TaxID=3346145 RepID=UPI00369B6D1F